MHFVCEQQIQEDRPAHPFFTAMALILVTGAARGLGVGICRQLRRQAPEAQLLVGARRVAAAQSLAEELGAMALELLDNGKMKGGGQRERKRGGICGSASSCDPVGCFPHGWLGKK